MTHTADAATGRPWGRAAAWLAFLGPFFFATYGLATWVTAQRPDVGAVVFAWEHAIPFLPWTIVPYWTVDLFYAVSLFVCVDQRELDTHAKRLLTAQVVAVASFLLFPLRFTFVRPEAGGIFGDLFAVLASFDQPFNQAPSLHVALLVILWTLYARRLHGPRDYLRASRSGIRARGGPSCLQDYLRASRSGIRARGGPSRSWRLLLHAWFALVAVSVLTTWQHHFVDVPTGALLGVFCVWLWPQNGPSPLADARLARDPRRLALAVRYAVGAAAAAGFAFTVGGAALWALWVTVALAMVALDYAWLGAAGFEKRDGRIAPAAAWLLAPYLAGAVVNARVWTHGRAAFDPVADDVFVGRVPTQADLERGGFRGIVDLTCEMSLDPWGRAYVNVPVLDLTLPERAALDAAVAAIERLRRNGRVLVCCALGVSRSATAVAAWLVATGRAPDADAALARVRAARPQSVLDDAHRARVAAMAARPSVA